jgi:hypothetical protein
MYVPFFVDSQGTHGGRWLRGTSKRAIHLAQRGSVSHILRIPRRILANGSVAARPRFSFVCRTLMLYSTG